MRIAICAAAGLALSGCIVHEVRVVQPDGAPRPLRGDGPAMHAIGTRLGPGLPAAEVRRGPLPMELVGIAWWRARDGALWRWRAVAATPEPWWQCFPCDLAGDLWPGDLVCAAELAVEPAPMREIPESELLAQAVIAGYARIPAPVPAPPVTVP